MVICCQRSWFQSSPNHCYIGDYIWHQVMAKIKKSMRVNMSCLHVVFTCHVNMLNVKLSTMNNYFQRTLYFDKLQNAFVNDTYCFWSFEENNGIVLFDIIYQWNTGPHTPHDMYYYLNVYSIWMFNTCTVNNITWANKDQIHVVYTTYIKHALWHRCLRSGGLCVGGNPPVWLGDHMVISH